MGLDKQGSVCVARLGAKSLICLFYITLLGSFNIQLAKTCLDCHINCPNCHTYTDSIVNEYCVRMVVPFIYTGFLILLTFKMQHKTVKRYVRFGNQFFARFASITIMRLLLNFYCLLFCHLFYGNSLTDSTVTKFEFIYWIK